jgi:branched-chain amino acid transport system substrate-binding protein
MKGERLVAHRLGVLGLVLGLLGTACTPFTNMDRASTGPDIVIGVPNSATGSVATEGGLSKQGYDLWRDQVNRAGGIDVQGVRHKVQLVYRDDQSDPQLSAKAAESLISQDHARFLLSPYGTTTTIAAAAVAEAHQMPMVDSNGAARQIFTQGYRYTFGVLAPADQYPDAVIDWETTLNPRPRTIAITTADDAASLFITQATADYSTKKGIQVVYMQKYPAGTTNLAPLVQQAKAKNPDIFFNSGHFLEAVAAHKAAMDLKLDAKLFAYSIGPTQPEFAQALGSAADFVIAAAPWTAQARFKSDYGPTTTQYVASYRQKYHTTDEPSFITADSTASGLALQIAIEHAQSLDPAKVRDALTTMDVNTFYGRLKFDGQGQNTFRNALILQIQNGRRETVWPPELASGQPAYPTPTWEVRFGEPPAPPKAKLPGTGQLPGR